MFDKETIRDIDIDNKQIVFRADWDVPAAEDGSVTDDFRIRASVPSIEYMLDHECSIVVISKRGRPEGPSRQLSMEPVAEAAGKILGREVAFVDDVVGEQAREAVKGLKSGDILLLQNTRFYPEEEAGDENFAKTLASYGDVFVFDAFAMAHRSEASVTGINKFLPSVAGFLIEKEITALSKAIDNPKKPVLAITGGAKLETKLPLLDNFMQFADNIVVAGVMANILLKVSGHNIGKSVFDQDELGRAEDVLTKAEAEGVKFVLPFEGVAVGRDLKDGERREVPIDGVGDEDYILDFGQGSIEAVKKLINEASTIIWNGPLGYYENPVFAVGSQEVAKAIAASPVESVVGGGDTADVVNSLGLAGKFSHVSTGGGASLDFMSGKKLPGVEALMDK